MTDNFGNASGPERRQNLIENSLEVVVAVEKAPRGDRLDFITVQSRQQSCIYKIEKTVKILVDSIQQHFLRFNSTA